MSIKNLPIPSNLIFPNSHSQFFQSSPNSLRFPFPLPSSSISSLPPQFHGGNQKPHHITQTQESISDFLQQQGLSVDESLSIASNCPKYADMLAESVRDLEDWNSMNNNSANTQGEELGFKEMVVSIAKEKGDNGKVAFLESLGLNLSSATGVARYLSSESLPVLSSKAKYLKEVIYSGCDDKEVERRARRMMASLSIPIDEDVQKTLSLFEKMEARRGGLGMLGSADASFRYIIESFPRLLLLSVKNLKLLVDFLETVGVSKRLVGNMFVLFPPLLFCQVREIKRKTLALNKVLGAANGEIGEMLLKYPWILSTSILENYEEIFTFLKTKKVPKESIDWAVRSWPHILGCSTSKLESRVDLFHDLGVRGMKLGRVLAKSPQLLLRKPQELLQVVSFLEDVGYDKVTTGKILCRCPELFAADIEKTLQKKVEFLTNFRVSKDHHPRVFKKYPELLLLDIDKAIVPRIKYLMEIGLSNRELVFMVRKFSPILGYGIEEVLRPKYKFLVETMGRSVSELVDYPRYFSYSLKEKIEPRFLVIKDTANSKCSLEEMLAKNDEEFAAQFMNKGDDQ